MASVAVAVGSVALYFSAQKQPAPWANSCAVSAKGQEVRIDPAQMRNAAIIVAVAQRRGLPTRASEIALATAWQESQLRNLDYGDRDSLGLFQQRPSQGWGTAEQVRDPYYAANAFYAALVKVKNWQTRDPGDVAQAVQKSGYPDAYDKRVAGATLLAQALTGDLPRTLTCSEQDPGQPDLAGLKAFGAASLPNGTTMTSTDAVLRITTPEAAQARSAAAVMVAHASKFGITKVALDGTSWTHRWPGESGWADDVALNERTVVVRLG